MPGKLGSAWSELALGFKLLVAVLAGLEPGSRWTQVGSECMGAAEFFAEFCPVRSMIQKNIVVGDFFSFSLSAKVPSPGMYNTPLLMAKQNSANKQDHS